MDKQSTLGLILIFVLLVAWMMWNSPQTKQPQVKNQKQEIVNDSVKTAVSQAEKKESAAREKQSANTADQSAGKYFEARKNGTERIITIESDSYKAELSTKGGLIKTWELKKFKSWDGVPVQLVDYDHRGDLTILLTTSDGKVINTRDLFFDANVPAGNVVLNKENNYEFEISFTLPSTNGGKLIKTMKFRNGEYGLDLDIQLINLAPVVANYEYELAWESGIRYAERNSVDEANFGAAYAYAGNELADVDAKQVDKKEQKDFSGAIDWIAVRNKYFGIVLIPVSTLSDGAYIEGSRKAMPNEGVYETYNISLKMPFKGGDNEHAAFKIFMGPLDHGILSSYKINLEKIMNLGWAWIIRPISEYIMLPVFSAIHYIVPNWGFVIIIFSLLIKLVLHPLSKKQMESMKRMQKLQPMMDEIREKYKDDPQKMNSSIMNLYKEYGVNPAGGCLPLLLQLPIMYALFAVLRGSIQLRQAGFIWWIKDLSVPDVIVTLPFRLPILGQDLSGIVLVMGISMFFQSKMTITDPRQKATVWMMPIMMTLVLNSLPSGLNLYYAMFNILAIGQQLLINKKHNDEPLRKIEPKKKKRGGFLARLPQMPKAK
jgi:YidC/Oxa1 family membrane protein insertase